MSLVSRLRRAACGGTLVALAAATAVADGDRPPEITHEPFGSAEAADRFEDGRAAYWERRFAAADLAFTEVLRAVPDHSLTHYHRALARWELEPGCPDAALADFDRAVELNPAAWWALGDRGVCHRRRGETEAAIADQSAVLAIDDRLAHAYVRRAYVYSQAGELDAAMRDLDAAVERAAHLDDYWLVEALVDRGDVHRRRDEPALARTDYERALEIDPTNVRAEAGLSILAE